MSAENWIYLPFSDEYLDISKFITIKEQEEIFDIGKKVRCVDCTMPDRNVYRFIREDAEAIMRYVRGLNP